MGIGTNQLATALEIKNSIPNPSWVIYADNKCVPHNRLAEYDSMNDDFTEIQDGNNFYLKPKPSFLCSDEILYKVFCTSSHINTDSYKSDK